MNRHAIYITKYALTKGILEYPGEFESEYNSWVCYDNGFPNGKWLFSYNDGYLNKEDALENAEKKRTAKLKSLQRQIEKLNQLKFE